MRAVPTDHDLVTTIRRFAAGEAELIGPLYELFHKEMIRAAGRLLYTYHLERVVYTELDMVDRALMSLYRTAKSGKLAWIETRGDFLKAFHRALRSAVAGVRSNLSTVKRGGNGRNGRPGSSSHRGRARAVGSSREVVELDRLESSAPDPALVVEAAHDYESLARHLAEPVLRDVFELSRIGCSVRDVATKLGMSPAAVMRARLRILSTWNKINGDHRRT